MRRINQCFLSDLDQIKTDMANGYIDKLRNQIGSGAVTRDITAREAWDFHSVVFNQNGLSKDAWTLNSLF